MAERPRSARFPAGGRRLVSAWLPVLCFELVVIFLSSRPHLHLPGAIPNLDKVAHFAEYAFLGLLLRRALGMTLRGAVAATVLALVLVGMLGAGDEWFQSTVPGRDSSAKDWAADLLGGSAGMLAFYGWTRRRTGAAPTGANEERA